MRRFSDNGVRSYLIPQNAISANLIALTFTASGKVNPELSCVFINALLSFNEVILYQALLKILYQVLLINIYLL